MCIAVIADIPTTIMRGTTMENFSYVNVLSSIIVGS